jgi:hypothetical protein
VSGDPATRRIVIGAYYEMPDGTVARTHGWDGAARTVAYALDDDAGPRTAAAADVEGSWRRRPDLSDFPDARDPSLPFVFDLHWDAKRRSDLVALLAGDAAEEVAAAMARNGIALTPAEEEAVAAARDNAAFTP